MTGTSSIRGTAQRADVLDVLDGRLGRTVVSAMRKAGRHPLVVDAMLIVPPFVHDLLEPHGDRLVVLALLVAFAVPTLARRRYPVAVFALLSAIALVQWFLDVVLLMDVVLLYAAYAIARRCSLAWTAATFVVLEFGALLAALRWSGDLKVWLVFLFVSGAVIAAMSLGIAARARAAYAIARAAEKAQAAEFARADERARIRREVHDVVAHSVSVMVALVDAAAVSGARSPEGAAEALRRAGATGRRALQELQITLDDDARDLSPAPTLDDVDDLVQQVRAIGREVALTRRGSCPHPLPAAVDLAAYRIVQEALTNTVKHSASRGLEVVLDRTEQELRVTVTDPGPARPIPHESDRRGRGVIGMQARATSCGGSLHAGPTVTGGWQVTAALAVGSSTR